jgi:hypothetical protein
MLKTMSFAGCVLAGAGCLFAGDPAGQTAAPLGGVMTEGARPFVPTNNRGRDIGHSDVLFNNGEVSYVGVRVVNDEQITPTALLYDNGGDDYANGNEMTQWLQAEDFVLGAQSNVTSVSFSVLTFGGIANWDGTVDWWIFNDGGGAPGGVVASGSGTNISMTFDQNQGFDFYDCTMDLDAPQCLDGKTTYWLGLHLNDNACATRDDLYWGTTAANGTTTGNEANNCVIGSWFSNGTEHSFSLSGDVGCGGNEVCVDFELRSPCIFNDTNPLRDEYAGQGIRFRGPTSLDGGASLDQCGSFGVNARSGVDFLAFNRNHNTGVQMQNGGYPEDPETILLDSPASAVSIWVSGGAFSARWSMQAFDGSGNLLDSDAIGTSVGTYGELKVAAAGIRRVVISETLGVNYFVMDDLCVTFGSNDCLNLAVSALVAGRRATWDVSGATPGEQVAVVYGFAPGNTTVNGLFGYCATFGIKGVNTTKVICRKNADGGGNVACAKTIPSGAIGTRVLSQAAERNTCPDECVSNLDDQVIQ